MLALQNGVEAASDFNRLLPSAGILAGRVHGFFELVDERVRHVGVEPSIAFGPVPSIIGGKAELMASCFDDAQISCTVHNDILPQLWEKLVLTSPLGGLGAMLALSIGSVRLEPAHSRLLETAMTEVALVADAYGVALPDDTVQKQMAFVSTFPDEAQSSLQRDLLAGRSSEYDYLTGAVVRLARQASVAVPVHDQIEASLKQQALI